MKTILAIVIVATTSIIGFFYLKTPPPQATGTNEIISKHIIPKDSLNMASKVSGVYQQEAKTMKEVYKNYFPIGAAITPEIDLLNPITASFIKKQFSSLTAKQAMQPFWIQRQENNFRWKEADMMVAFAQSNHLMVRGHCLIYSTRPNHMPGWFYKDKGGIASRELVLKRMKDHIDAVVGRYKGKVYCWDVVNEAMSGKKGEQYFPTDPLYQIVGKEYIAKAFEYAHAADPNAKLFYNDSFEERLPQKRDNIFKLLKELKAQGVPVTGIGMQCHLGIDGMSRAYFQETINLFKSIGLEFQITELDVSIYKRGLKPLEMAKIGEDYTENIKQSQAELYKMIFEVSRLNKSTVKGITFWGTVDNDQEPNSLTKRMGKRNYPFLFDSNHKPKKALEAVLNF